MGFFAYMWVGLLILFLVLEGSTVALVSLWFAVGSLAAIVAALLGHSQKQHDANEQKQYAADQIHRVGQVDPGQLHSPGIQLLFRAFRFAVSRQEKIP